MNKQMIRRVSAAIILLSFFLPWFEDFFMDYSGLTIITEGFKDGSEEALFLAGITLLSAIFALLILLVPKVVSTILFLLSSIFWLYTFYGAEDMSDYRMYGSYIFTLGVIGIVLSFFMPGNKLKEDTTGIAVPQGEGVQMTPAYNGEEMSPSFSTQASILFCKNCGNKLAPTANFCTKCGNKIQSA